MQDMVHFSNTLSRKNQCFRRRVKVGTTLYPYTLVRRRAIRYAEATDFFDATREDCRVNRNCALLLPYAFAVRKRKLGLNKPHLQKLTDMPLQPHNTSSYIGFKWIANRDIEGQKKSIPQRHIRLTV